MAAYIQVQRLAQFLDAAEFRLDFGKGGFPQRSIGKGNAGNHRLALADQAGTDDVVQQAQQRLKREVLGLRVGDGSRLIRRDWLVPIIGRIVRDFRQPPVIVLNVVRRFKAGVLGFFRFLRFFRLGRVVVGFLPGLVGFLPGVVGILPLGIFFLPLGVIFLPLLVNGQAAFQKLLILGLHAFCRGTETLDVVLPLGEILLEHSEFFPVLRPIVEHARDSYCHQPGDYLRGGLVIRHQEFAGALLGQANDGL